MAESFDPYYTWLGIPPAQQPPNHYRLLGIELFEANPDVIERAADRCMADLRTYQTGKHSTESQKLLNEVAAAKVTLSAPKKKADYDAALRARLVAQENEAVEASVFTSLGETTVRTSSPSAKTAAKSKSRTAVIGGAAVAAVGLVLVAGWVYWSGGSDRSPSPDRSAGETTAASGQKQSADARPDSASPPTAGAPLPENLPRDADAPAPPPSTAPQMQQVAANLGGEKPAPSQPSGPDEGATMESLLKAGRLSENLLKPGAWGKAAREWRLDRQGDVFVFDNRDDADVVSGALQVVSFDTPVRGPIFAAATSRAEGVGREPTSDYSLFIDLEYEDKTSLYGQAVAFDAGTHDWQRRELVIRPAKPVKRVSVNLLLRRRTGKAWFRDPELRVLKSTDAPTPVVAASTAAAQTPPTPTEEAATKRLPIPSADVQREVGAAIEETYRITEAKDPEAKIKLAKELSAAAGKSAKPEEQYVLLRKAIDLACDGGDAALMLETLGPMTEAFAIDPFAAQTAMLERFAKGPRSPARVQSLVEASVGVIDDALAEDRYEIAAALARSLVDACSRSSPQVRREAAERRKRVQQLQKQYEEFQKALEALKANPQDPEANRTAGSWYCLVKDDWKAGLPHLAKGSDALLKSLADRELSSPPAAPEDQLTLADAWWEGAAERRGEEKAAMLRCAGHWYEQAIGQLQGINRTKAEKRLAEIAALAQAAPPRPGREPPRAIAPFDAKRARVFQLQWARYLKVPVEFTNSIGMRFVLIPPGEFDMGTTEQEVERRLKEAKRRGLPGWYQVYLPLEAPQHRVRLTRAFYLGTCEVTQAQFAHVMGVNGRVLKPSGPDAPQDNVSWNEAAEFCGRLCRLRGERPAAGAYRLPSEAEWEFACRAGTTTAYSFGDDEALLSQFAWGDANTDGKTHPVGQKRPNHFGLYDMPGNAWEWCADIFSPEYYRQSPPADPPGASSGSARVKRGGFAGDNFAEGFRCAIRNPHDRADRDPSFGFRVARSLPGQEADPKEDTRPAKDAKAKP